MELPNGIPSHDTFNRTFATVKTATLQAVLLPWLLVLLALVVWRRRLATVEAVTPAPAATG